MKNQKGFVIFFIPFWLLVAGVAALGGFGLWLGSDHTPDEVKEQFEITQSKEYLEGWSNQNTVNVNGISDSQKKEIAKTTYQQCLETFKANSNKILEQAGIPKWSIVQDSFLTITEENGNVSVACHGEATYGQYIEPRKFVNVKFAPMSKSEFLFKVGVQIESDKKAVQPTSYTSKWSDGNSLMVPELKGVVPDEVVSGYMNTLCLDMYENNVSRIHADAGIPSDYQGTGTFTNITMTIGGVMNVACNSKAVDDKGDEMLISFSNSFTAVELVQGIKDAYNKLGS
jgi:hypothetical protein